MKHKDADPLLIRQGINQLTHQFLSFLPGIGQFRLIFDLIILDPILKSTVLILCSHFRKQHRIPFRQRVLRRVCHNPPQPSGEGLRLRQSVQPIKSFAIGVLQDILGRLLIFHILERQIVFTFISRLIEKPKAPLIPRFRKGNRFCIVHVVSSSFPSINYSEKTGCRQCSFRFRSTFHRLFRERYIFRFSSLFSTYPSISCLTRQINHWIKLMFFSLSTSAIFFDKYPRSSCCCPTPL